MYDYSKLYGRMKEKQETQNSLSEKIGISPSSLNLKLNNKGDFRQAEIFGICDILEIDVEQIPDYFFAH